MTNPELPSVIKVYYKIPYTETTGIFKIKDSLTITELLVYIDTEIRPELNIHFEHNAQVLSQLNISSEYDIEVIDAELDETGCKLESSEETLREKYRNKLFNNSLAYYFRLKDRY
jgi:hypothetical protein